MRLALQFARRYLFSRKSTNAINVITAVSMLGITVCTAAFILILSVFNGFEGLVTKLYDSFYPDIRIEATEGKVFVPDDSLQQYLAQHPDVREVAEVVEENGLLVYDGRQQPATIKGVNTAFVDVTGLDTSMAYGDTFLLEDDTYQYAVIGSGIDQALQVGQLKDPLHSLSVFMPRRGGGRSLIPLNEFERDEILVWGVFVIQDDFDNQYIFTPIDFVRNLLDYEEEVTALEVALQPNRPLARTTQEIARALGPAYQVKSRYQQNALLYQVMNAERLVVYLILTFVLVIVAFNMIGSLSMIVIEKKRDISVLKAMGATTRQVRQIFLAEGVLQSVISLIIGFVLATALVLAQQYLGLIPIQSSGTFVVQYYPVALNPWDYLFVALIVLALGFAASWFPAVRAARQYALQDLS